MKKETKKALLRSIEHWKRLATGKFFNGEDIGPHQCSLCNLFFNNLCISDDDGEECPVYSKTKQNLCGGSPYRQAADAAEKYGLDSDEFRKEAKLELKFLRSLLPKKKN